MILEESAANSPNFNIQNICNFAEYAEKNIHKSSNFSMGKHAHFVVICLSLAFKFKIGDQEDDFLHQHKERKCIFL